MYETYALFRDKKKRGAIVSNNSGITALYLPEKRKAVLRKISRDFKGAVPDKKGHAAAVKLLEDYFSGRGRNGFAGLRLNPGIFKNFTGKVLKKTLKIPYGETRNYKWAGSGKARAAGGALGRNPVPVIIPCHRVIASGGSPGGYTPGLRWKLRLLKLERI